MTFEIPELPAIPETPDLQKYFNRAKIAVAVNIGIIAIICVLFRPLVGAKCLFIELAIGAGLFCLAVFYFRLDIFHILSTLEALAVEGRDETLVQMRNGRAQLRQLTVKLDQTIHPPQHENAMHDLFQHAMPVVQILMSKEKNWLQLGMFGWRVAQDAIRMFDQRNQRDRRDQREHT